MMSLIVLLGGLGLLLTAGAIIGLVAEIVRRQPHRWQILILSGLMYLGAFVSEPPAAWKALSNSGTATMATSLRALALGVFMSVLCLAYISACRKVDELCAENKALKAGRGEVTGLVTA